jgi:hypothetical protein
MNDGLLKQIDLYSGKELKVLAEPKESDVLYRCNEIILSQDKKKIVCSKIGEGDVEVWDIETGNIVARISAPIYGSQSSAMFVNRDTSILLINKNGIDDEKHFWLYKLPDDRSVVESARQNLIRELTPEERKRYFID